MCCLGAGGHVVIAAVIIYGHMLCCQGEQQPGPGSRLHLSSLAQSLEKQTFLSGVCRTSRPAGEGARSTGQQLCNAIRTLVIAVAQGMTLTRTCTACSCRTSLSRCLVWNSCSTGYIRAQKGACAISESISSRLFGTMGSRVPCTQCPVHTDPRAGQHLLARGQARTACH